MKKLLTLCLAVLLSNLVYSQPMTKEERKELLTFIKWTTKELKTSLKGLSAAQLNFKPGQDAWSPQECLYHIAYSEGALRTTLDAALKSPADPATKASLTTTDFQIKNNIMDRSSKFKTATPFEPLNTGYKSFDEAMDSFKAKRALLEYFIKTTDLDLRNHIVVRTFGKMDAYQFVLFLAGHTNRHTQQIEEAKGIAGYPGK
ncbi:MAG: DinB family protein [Saprospiraceae bacterium]|nr:DinB family protein [Saprospiraceae bacterium]